MRILLYSIFLHIHLHALEPIYLWSYFKSNIFVLECSSTQYYRKLYLLLWIVFIGLLSSSVLVSVRSITVPVVEPWPSNMNLIGRDPRAPRPYLFSDAQNMYNRVVLVRTVNVFMYCIVLMGWSLLPNALRPFQDLLCSANLSITRTWICRLNFAQRPFFSGLRLFNEPEISDSLKVPPGGLVLRIFTSWKNPSTSSYKIR